MPCPAMVVEVDRCSDERVARRIKEVGRANDDGNGAVVAADFRGLAIDRTGLAGEQPDGSGKSLGDGSTSGRRGEW